MLRNCSLALRSHAEKHGSHCRVALGYRGPEAKVGTSVSATSSDPTEFRCELRRVTDVGLDAKTPRTCSSARKPDAIARPPELTHLSSDRLVSPAMRSAALEAFRVPGLCHRLSVRTTRRL